MYISKLLYTAVSAKVVKEKHKIDTAMPKGKCGKYPINFNKSSESIYDNTSTVQRKLKMAGNMDTRGEMGSHLVSLWLLGGK